MTEKEQKQSDMESVPEAKAYYVEVAGSQGITLKITKDQAQSICDQAQFFGKKIVAKISPLSVCFINIEA